MSGLLQSFTRVTACGLLEPVIYPCSEMQIISVVLWTRCRQHCPELDAENWRRFLKLVFAASCTAKVSYLVPQIGVIETWHQTLLCCALKICAYFPGRGLWCGYLDQFSECGSRQGCPNDVCMWFIVCRSLCYQLDHHVLLYRLLNQIRTWLLTEIIWLVTVYYFNQSLRIF